MPEKVNVSVDTTEEGFSKKKIKGPEKKKISTDEKYLILINSKIMSRVRSTYVLNRHGTTGKYFFKVPI